MAIHSIKRQIILFGSIITALFLAQIYMTMDPLRLLGTAGHRYEKTVGCEHLLREILNASQMRHDLVQPLLEKPDPDALAGLQDIQETLNAHVRQLARSKQDPEWVSSYKTLRDIQTTYSKDLAKVFETQKTIHHLQTDLFVRSIKPIFDLLKEVKLVSLTNQESRNVTAIQKTITTIDGQIKKLMEKPTLQSRDFTALNQKMEAVTKPLAFLVRITESKRELHTEMERLQALVLDYFASIHQWQTLVVDISSLKGALEPQEKLLIELVHTLLHGIEESKKELFQSIYEEGTLLKKNSILFTGGLVILVALFSIMILLTIRRPLKTFATLLRISPTQTDTPIFQSPLDEIQDLVEATDYLKRSLFSSIQNNFAHILETDNQKIERKLDMLAASAVELSKVSASIAKIPKIFDKKFKAIQAANDDARTHFRQMVKTCEALDAAMKDVSAQGNLPSETLQPLKQAVENVMGQAHSAAIEAQTLGLRFNSLVRTQDDTLEVSKLFSKAGTRINQLARTLREDVNQFFHKMREASPKAEESAPTSSKDPKL